MAYAAVASLSQILDQLLYSDRYPKPQVEYLYSKVCSLQSSLEKLSPVPTSKRSEVEQLESQIRDAVYRAQDAIESSLIRSSDSSASLLLAEIKADLDPITETAEEMSRNMKNLEISHLLAENDPPPISASSSGNNKAPILVGIAEDHRRLKDALLGPEKNLQVIAITGSPGIGKTTLARTIYDDNFTIRQFNVSAWVTVSQDYNEGRILSNILSSIGKRPDQAGNDSDEQLRNRLHQELYNLRYLIVMDDIWDASVLQQVRSSLPNPENGSRIIITSRDKRIAEHDRFSISHVMQRLGEENSWRLLREHAFGGGNCPPNLEGIGRNIVGKCEGTPLLIVVVAGLLSQGPETEEYWKNIEADVHGAAASNEESYLRILYLSYHNLPSRLKACFLYMAAFPEDGKILVSKLVMLWVAEGFLTLPSPASAPQALEQVAEQYLEDLIRRNLISVGQVSADGRPKTCSLQGNLRQVAVQECQRQRFFHVVKRYSEELPEGTKTQRRVSVHNNILLCSKEVYDRTKSFESARSLVYAGPDLHHPFPHFLTFELLRVLDALSVYFLELPNALFELIHLRYLAFTCDEDLPHSISKLQNLLVLIVRQHPNILFRRISILPEAIWNLPQLRHLLFTESFLPNPCGAQSSVFFKNLQSLSNVNVACCTKEILENIPNLKKLCTWIEGPDVVQLHLDHLQHLEVFKFTVLNPSQGHKTEFHPKLAFPDTLRKLSLSGCGLPWEDMAVIAELPHLQVLKLREFAFKGPKWLPNRCFEQLKFLLLESLDLEFLNAKSTHFPVLERMIIKCCYQLEEISSRIGFIGSLELIELVDCSPEAVEAVEDIKDEQEGYNNRRLKVRIVSSWE